MQTRVSSLSVRRVSFTVLHRSRSVECPSRSQAVLIRHVIQPSMMTCCLQGRGWLGKATGAWLGHTTARRVHSTAIATLQATVPNSAPAPPSAFIGQSPQTSTHSHGSTHPRVRASRASCARKRAASTTRLPSVGEGAVEVSTAASGATTTQTPQASGVWEVWCTSARPDGRSYLEKLSIPVPTTGGGSNCIASGISEAIPCKDVKFRETPGNYLYDWHTAPKRQFIINLDAAVHVTASSEHDGTTSVVLPAGTLFAVDDLVGDGHKSRALDGLSRRSVFIAVDPDVSFDAFRHPDSPVLKGAVE